MRKSVQLTIVGISIVVAGVSLGVTLTSYLGLRAYSPKGEAQAAVTPAGRGVPAASPEEWTNLFAPGDGMTLASRLPAANTKGAAQATRSNFVLVGTIVSSSPSARRAVLWSNGMKEPKAFREKEEVEPGAILSSIERDKVRILRGSEREQLEILPVGSRARPGATAAKPGSPGVAAAALPSPLSASPAAEASRPSSARPPAVGAPKTPFGGEEEEETLTPRQQRRRAMGLKR